MIELARAVLLGAIQGVTEFLPISSTAHLILAERLLRLDQNVYGLTFDMALNLGTTVALVAYFRRELWTIAKDFRLPSAQRPLSDRERLPWLIIWSTLAVGAIGLVLESKIDSVFRSPLVIAASLAAVSLLMFLAEARAHSRAAALPTDRQLLGTGLSQALALVPGVSRSGITISTGLLLGLDRVNAARYSFLLSVPITSLAILKRLGEFAAGYGSHPLPASVLLSYAVGTLVSGIVGYYSIRYLLSYLARATLATFAYYRLALAAAILLWFIFR